ncbi:MAG: efflux RND transporter periplasmic adaptor subunit [Planctomycetaceae bacterium]
MTQAKTPPVPAADPPVEHNGAPAAGAPASTPTPQAEQHRSLWNRMWSAAQLILSLVVTLGTLVYLVWMPGGGHGEDTKRTPKIEVVETLDPAHLQIRPGTALDTKLDTLKVQTTSINSPLMMITGYVVASLRPGKGNRAGDWQFKDPDTLSSFADWQKATADVTFTAGQLARTKELAEKRFASQEKVVKRYEKVLEAGTATAKESEAEKTKLMEYDIQGRSEIYAAETASRTAIRSETVAARQLQAAGLEPDLLLSTTPENDIILAEVPEAAFKLVSIGQKCSATFYGLPGHVFEGRVDRIAPSLSVTRRAMRVLIVIHDPDDLLRPNMFADVGLGTNERDAVLIPADGVIHVGRTDYVLVEEKPEIFRITQVQVGEPHDAQVEIVNGLAAGDTVISKGAVLLKPALVRALNPDLTKPTTSGQPQPGIAIMSKEKAA